MEAFLRELFFGQLAASCRLLAAPPPPPPLAGCPELLLVAEKAQDAADQKRRLVCAA